jgi:hypothetical protein
MKIEGGPSSSRGVTSSSPRRSNSTPASGFEPEMEAPARASAAAPASAPHSLDAILALQAEALDPERRRRQVRRGKDALDALEKLERAIAEGVAPASLRTQLESLRRASEHTGEPDLDALLLEIDTRVAVELAKLEQAVPRP